MHHYPEFWCMPVAVAQSSSASVVMHCFSSFVDDVMFFIADDTIMCKSKVIHQMAAWI